MNIQQAIRTGRKIRRKIYDCGTPRFFYFSEFNNLNEEDILADDWVVEPVTVTITAQQFWDAYESYIRQMGSERPSTGTYMRIMGMARYMADKLGLEV